MTARTTIATTRVNAIAVIGKGRMRRRNVSERPSELRAGYGWLAGLLYQVASCRAGGQLLVRAQASLHLAGPPPEGHTTRCVRLRCRGGAAVRGGLRAAGRQAAARRYTVGATCVSRAKSAHVAPMARQGTQIAGKRPGTGDHAPPPPSRRTLGAPPQSGSTRGNSRERESCSRGAVGPAPAAPNALPRRSRGTGRRNSPSPKKGGPARARSAAPQLARSTVGSSAGPCARLPARGARARCPPQAAARRLSGRSCAPYEGMTGAPPSSPRARRRTFSPLAV